MFFLFFILIVGPVIVNKLGVLDGVTDNIQVGSLNIVQPTGWNNNDTNSKVTGTATQGGGAGAQASGAASAPPAASSGGGGGGGDNPFSLGNSKRAVATGFFYA